MSTILFEYQLICNAFTIAQKEVLFCASLLSFAHDIISRYVAVSPGSSDPRLSSAHPDDWSSRVAQSAWGAVQHEAGNT